MIEEYKNSIIGKIPFDWEVRTLGEISEQIKDGTHGTHKEVVGGIPLLSAKDIRNGKIYIPDDCRKLSFEDFKSIHKNFQIKNGDVLLTVVGSIGRVAIVENYNNQYTFQRSVGYIRLTDNYIPMFFMQYFQSKTFIKQLSLRSNASAQAGVYLGELSKIPVPSIPFLEQQKIAEILSTVDDKIETIDKQIIETQEFKKGLMQRLLTKGIGHTEFKDSPLGTIPKSWEVVELDEISSTTRLAGYEYSEYWEESIDGEITALRGYNIGKNKLLLHNVIKISEELSQKLVRSRLFKGDVVFPCVGTIGNAIVIKEDNKYHINQNIAKITPDKNLDSYFLMQYLISPMCRKEIKRFNATTSQPNVLVGSLRKFRIPFPSNIEEQIKISNILGYIDEKIDVLMEKKVHYKEIKQGLMQQLLTGKIRVKV